jgi:uncharacterized repeat protein (TIGR01451 family)
MNSGSLKSKFASYTIVWCLVFSMFAGLLVVGMPSVAKAQLPSILPNGDVIIGEDYELSAWPANPDLEGSTYYMDGNLIIRAGGVVTIEDGILSFTQDTGLDRIAGTADDHAYAITVENGGQLILSNATLTTHLNQLFDFPSLGVLIQNGGSLIATDSVLKFPGHILIDESSAILTNTTLTGHDAETITAFCNNDAFPADYFDDSADLLITSSDVQLIDSSVENIFKLDPATSAPSDLFNHDYEFASDTPDRDVVTYELKRHPSQFGALDTSTGPIANLTADDLKYVTVAPGQRLFIDTTALSGLAFPAISSFNVSLNVKYQTEPGYATGAFVRYGLQNGPLNDAFRPIDTSSPFEDNEDIVNTSNLGFRSAIDVANMDISFINAPGSGGDVLINEVWFTIEFQMETLKNITAAFSSNMLAINSFLDVNFDNVTSAHNQFDVLDNSVAYLYGVSGNEAPASPDSLPAYEIDGRTIEVYTLSKGISDNTGADIFDLRSNDGSVYPVSPGQTMALQNFGIGSLSGDVEDVVLSVRSTASALYDSNIQYVEWGHSFSDMENTSIRPNATATTQTYDLFNEGVDSFTNITDLCLRFVNTAAAGIVSFNQVALEVTTTASIYVYRWLDFNALDEQQLPISGAYVNATVQLTGEPAYYVTDAGVSSVPPADVLDYLGKTSTDYIRTDESGSVLIPLLAEYLTMRDQLWNLQVLGPYALDIQYQNATGVDFEDDSGVSWNVYPQIALNDQTSTVNFTMDGLFLDRPDLGVTGLVYNPTTVYLGDSVVFTASISNIGLTGARDVVVNFTDSLSSWTYETNIPFLAAGDSIDIDASWIAMPAGLHAITVRIDPKATILEVTRNNNDRSIQVNVLPNLPELAITSSDITFDPQPAFTGQYVTVRANVSNVLGRADANNVSVAFYNGDPQSGGQWLGTTIINVSAGTSNYTTFIFVPTQLGVYDIFVWVNPSRSLSEYSYANNLASNEIAVQLTVDASDLIVDGQSTFTFTGASFTHRGKIVVKDNGTLVITGATLSIDQNFDNEFGIYVIDNGSILLSQATLNSNRQIWLYLMDNGRLSMDNSTLFSAVSVSLDNEAQIFMWGSTISYRLIAPITSNGVVYAYNSTFFYGLTEFGGNALGYFTSVTIPSIRPLNNAVVWNYHWIDVFVVDGNNMKLPNATVNLARYDIGYPLYAAKMTDATGHALFQALSEVINSTTHSPAFLGNYRLNATYLFGGVNYNTVGNTSVSLASYSEPLERNDPEVTLSIPGALPDLDPPLTVSNSLPLRGSNVTLSTSITNSGVVNAYSVLVRFKDETSIVPWSKDVVVQAIEPGHTVNLQVTWMASYPLGNHTLSVTVDPENTMRELDKSNNYNSTVVSVRGVSVLSVSTGDITVTPVSITTNGSAVIEAVIHNSGDITANLVNVSFMDRLPSGQTVQIGYNVIPSIINGNTGVATVNWGPNRPGTHMLTVTIKWGVPSQSISSNNGTLSIAVKNYADLLPTAISFQNGVPVNVNDNVTILASINNVGETAATNVVVSFMLDGVEFGTVTIAQIAPGQSVTASKSWTVQPIGGLRIISVEVNPEQAIREIRYDNNVRTLSVNVIDNRPDLVFVGGISVTSANVPVGEAVIGQTIIIRVNVSNEGLTPAMNAIILFSFVDSDNFVRDIGMVPLDFNPNQIRQVEFNYTVGASGITIGNYTIKVTANSNATFEEANETNNVVITNFVVNAPNPSIDTSLDQYSLKPDSDITISGEITNSITHSTLSGVQVIVAIYNSQNVRVGDNYSTTSSSTGAFSKIVHIPADLASGTYYLKVTAIVPGGTPRVENSPQFQVVVGSEIGIPLWVWILIIVLVLASILIGSWLIYRGLGRMVECGECGALIPEASKRCPKCGVEFESGTAKCSQCGAWIPGTSKECPECGAKFATEPMAEQENEYIKKMRGEYDEFVTPYREQAKSALGKKYSEAKFAEWWKKQPSYVTFERWLSQEEEKRKVAGTAFPCPVCGTLNPKGSAICHKCGTVFDALKGAEGQPEGAVKEGEQKPLRRIVRRPAEKKLIPKKEAKPEEGALPEQPAAIQPEEPKSP